MQPIARLIGIERLGKHQRLVDKSGENISQRPCQAAGGDLLVRLCQGESAGEYREPGEQLALIGVEEVEAPD